MEDKGSLKPFLISITGATLWGLSGTASSALFEVLGMNPLALLSIRLIVSSALMLVLFKPKFPGSDLKLFAIYVATTFILQLSYLETIDLSNAPTATFLQFLYFPMVVLFELIMRKIRFSLLLLAGLILSLTGIVFLTISINPDSTLRISLDALIVGLICALSAAIYTVISSPLVRKYGSISVVSWGFFFAALISIPTGIMPILNFVRTLNPGSIPLAIFLILFVSVVGTLVAFTLYSYGMRKISASSAALSGTMEPISASLGSSIFLDQYLGDFQYFGGFLIIISILLCQYSIIKQKPKGNRIRRLIKIRMR
ncbi:MAG: DMT family transporter [Cuniculiplasma sp.]|nr:DMT family transporter [Cuniculiplasma sp.]